MLREKLRRGYERTTDTVTAAMCVRWGRQFGIALVIATLVLVSPAAAQDGLCSIPGADSALGLLGTVIQGLIVIAGIILMGSGLLQQFEGRGQSDARRNALVGLGILAIGLVFPDLVSFVAEQMGTSLDDAGAGCIFGG